VTHAYWNDWYFGWGWFLWFGIVFLLFSSIGNWGYTYRAHQKYDKPPRKEAFDILDARYAKGEITREEYGQMKSEIAKE
jgi:putative membrane protein